MSNVSRFPDPPRPELLRVVTGPGTADSTAPDPAAKRSRLGAHDALTHAVQFYEAPSFLYESVAKFLAPALASTDRVLIIATPEHVDGFAAQLGEDVFHGALGTGQLTVLDARQTLAKFMVGDMPDPDLFQHVLGRVITEMLDGQPSTTRLRAYGEMVDLLWRDGCSRAAIRLEEMWNEAARTHSFALLCAYAMHGFYEEGDTERFRQVCDSHTHVLPTETFSEITDAQARLREISLLQQRALALESEIEHRKQLEAALRSALAERNRVEDELRASVQREREAREHAEASDSFKEIFFGILGHDLRNPLNTILTTARLMHMRDELPPESHKRLHRMISSGVRMQRMIEQILDVTRARHATGLRIDARERDLAALVAKMVDEIRASNPHVRIDVALPHECVLTIDADRFEQVLSNLLGNAVTHGDPEQPITVSLTTSGSRACLAVHNHGTPIDPAFMPRLFDPFTPGPKPSGRSDGLGLGLYISQRIVGAHGGTLEASSSSERGTRFEVSLPAT